jgi:predicted HD phosphohydrolase
LVSSSETIQKTGCLTRIQQVAEGILPKPHPAEERVTRDLLTPSTQALFDRLPVHDRRHLVAVTLKLQQAGVDDRDLLVASLLHDVGKADERGHVTLMHRIAKVMLEEVSPQTLDWLARPGNGRLRHGFQLAVEHASLGAAQAERAGCSARAVWLIRNHESMGSPDPELRQLIAIDQVTP